MPFLLTSLELTCHQGPNLSPDCIEIKEEEEEEEEEEENKYVNMGQVEEQRVDGCILVDLM